MDPGARSLALALFLVPCRRGSSTSSTRATCIRGSSVADGAQQPRAVRGARPADRRRGRLVVLRALRLARRGARARARRRARGKLVERMHPRRVRGRRSSCSVGVGLQLPPAAARDDAAGWPACRRRPTRRGAAVHRDANRLAATLRPSVLADGEMTVDAMPRRCCAGR